MHQRENLGLFLPGCTALALLFWTFVGMWIASSLGLNESKWWLCIIVATLFVGMVIFFLSLAVCLACIMITVNVLEEVHPKVPMQPPAPPAVENLPDVEEVFNPCAACKERSVGVTLSPCSHAVLCRECAVPLVMKVGATCPYCRSPVEGIVFLASEMV